MSADPTSGAPPDGAPAEGEATEPTEARHAYTFHYRDQSRVADEGEGARLALFADLDRDPVRATGRITDPIAVREALSTLHAIVQSDLRYKPKDRTAYLAWKRLQQQSSTLAAWQAQKAYFEWIARNDPAAWFLLDPVVTVHPDALVFEVFSKDEGSYAQLSIGHAAIEREGDSRYGTTHIDFSDALFAGIQRMRSYRETRLDIGADAVRVATAGAEVIEKRISVPDAWLRGFLQVQSAGTLTRARCTLAPIDLYNALRHLRLNADHKKKGRALRLELVPGEAPRLVLEPWELVIEGTAGAYTGRRAEVLRIWGRRRLMLLNRFLPFADSIEIHGVGSGLPSFWVLRAGAITLTLGLTGFTAANWSQALLFDILLPRPEDGPDPVLDRALAHLATAWHDTAAGIAAAIAAPLPDVRRALQAACQRGLAMYDIAADRYRLRRLVADPPDPDALRYRTPAEREAHALLDAPGAIRIESSNTIPTVGTELVGKVVVAAEKREYRPSMLIDDEGRVTRADCTCPTIRKNGLRRGPCAHLIALRLALAYEKRRQAEKGRAAIEVETRTYARRHARGETVYHLSLDRDRLRVRWGARSDERLRMQNLLFDTPADARAAYFDRIDRLEAQGYLDATAE